MRRVARTEAGRRASSGESLGHHLAVHDGDVDEEQEDDEEVVEEAQQTHDALGDEVERRRQIHQRSQQNQQDPQPEHPEQASHGEHLSEGVPEQRGDVPEPVQQLHTHTHTLFTSGPLSQCKHAVIRPYSHCRPIKRALE